MTDSPRMRSCGRNTDFLLTLAIINAAIQDEMNSEYDALTPRATGTLWLLVATNILHAFTYWISIGSSVLSVASFYLSIHFGTACVFVTLPLSYMATAFTSYIGTFILFRIEERPNASLAPALSLEDQQLIYTAYQVAEYTSMLGILGGMIALHFKYARASRQECFTACSSDKVAYKGRQVQRLAAAKHLPARSRRRS